MPASQGLRTSLNAIREISSEIYHRYIPMVDENTSIEEFAKPIFDQNVPEIYNEFVGNLINRIVYTQMETKELTNPLRDLEGQPMPLGEVGQEIYVNPAKGRRFNPRDFAGILQMYEADVKVQYLTKNMDVQYPLTIIRTSLKKAFVSWGDLEKFITTLTNSLYNGLHNDEYNWTKMLIGSAYSSNSAVMELVQNPTTKELAETFVKKARKLFLDFQQNDDSYNAWHKVGGSGRPILTRTNAEDIIMIIRSDVSAELDVDVLAKSFNIDKTTLLGRIYTVKNFDVYDYDEYDNKYQVFDGSKIVGMICDKRWFKIKPQEQYLDWDKNPNNRSMQYFLNCIKMYEYSLFANCVIFATEVPTIQATAINFKRSSYNMAPNASKYLTVDFTPANATNTVTFSTNDTDKITITKVDDGTVKVTVKGIEGDVQVTATSGALTTTASIHIVETPIAISDIDIGSNNITLASGTDDTLEVTITPEEGNEQITYTSSNVQVFTVEKLNNTQVKITAVGEGSASLIATTGKVTSITTVTVE